MKPFPTALSVSTLALMLGGMLTSRDALAASQVRSLYTNPTGICQSALPTFDGVIRKRPLAVQNEGETNAFITCSFTSQSSLKQVVVYFASNDGLNHLVSCTGVSGFNTSSTNEYIVKSTTVSADGVQDPLIWKAADFSGSPTTFPSSKFSISCNLLPGVGINDSVIDFSEDVGL